MLKVFLIQLFLTFWFFFNESYGEKLPVFTTNTTFVEVNQSISCKCDVSHLDKWSNSNYDVHFASYGTYFSYAYFSVTCKFSQNILIKKQ